MRVRLKGITEDIDRHGNIRIYYRAKGRPKVRLREPFGTAEFMREYQCAQLNVPYVSPKARAEERKRNRLKPAAEGTFAHLCQQYYRRAEGLISADTMMRRRLILEKVCRRYPDAMWADLTPKIVAEIRDEIAKTNGAKNNVVKAIGALFSWAKKVHLTETNPAHGVGRLHSGDGFHAWTIEEVQKYCERHPFGSKAHRALVFFLFTGLRMGDVARLGWKHVTVDGRISTRPQKTSKTSKIGVDIPILPPLRLEIEATPKDQPTFMLTSFGKPYTPRRFGRTVSEWCDQAGLPHCTAHGLRKAGATIAAELGATEAQLMAIYGWTTLQQASLYTRTANRRRLSDQGMSLVTDAWSGILNVPAADAHKAASEDAAEVPSEVSEPA